MNSIWKICIGTGSVLLLTASLTPETQARIDEAREMASDQKLAKVQTS